MKGPAVLRGFFLGGDSNEGKGKEVGLGSSVVQIKT